MRFIVIIITLATLTSVANAQTSCNPTKAALTIPGTLTGAINPTSAPLQYIDENGKLVGLDVDFGEAIAKKLCLKMEFLKTEFAIMIPGLKSGRFDMIDTFMYYTPDRAAQVHMIPYAAGSSAIVVERSATGLSKLQDFAGKRFATQLGSVDDRNVRAASDAMVKDGKDPIDIHTFPNYSDVLQALSAGQVDGAMIGTEQAYYYQGKGVTFFRIAASGLYPHAEALAFKDDTLAQDVSDALNAMKADGSLDTLFNSYHHCMLPPPYKVTTGPIPEPICPPTKN